MNEGAIDCHGNDRGLNFNLKVPESSGYELAKLAEKTDLERTFCHYRPKAPHIGTRSNTACFTFILMNWRRRPLSSYRTIIELIPTTTTNSGLKIQAERDWNRYDSGVPVSKAELAALPLLRHEFHGIWNCTLRPATNA
jgi:hypothetical protein